MDGWKRAYEAAGWTYRLWGNDELANIDWPLADRMSETKEINGVADCMRWHILNVQGGFLVDADAECVEVIPDEWLNAECFACWENEIARPGLVAAGYFASEAGGKLVGHIMMDLVDGGPLPAGKMAWETVGPGIVTRLAPQHPELMILPARTFIPLHFSQCLAPGHEKIYARQLWGSTTGYKPEWT